MSASTAETHRPPTVQFGRLERRGVLLGLSGTQLAFVGLAAIVATLALYVAGAPALLGSGIIWLPILVVGTARVAGRSVASWLPILASRVARRATGTTSEVSGAWSAPPPREMRLPGIAGALSVVEEPRTGAALVIDRHAGTATAIARVSGKGFVLADLAVQDDRVGGWATVLATLCHQPALARIQVLCHGVPRPPTVRESMVRNEGSRGHRLLDGFLRDGGDRKENLIAIAFRTPRGRAVSGARIGELGHHLAALAEALRAADLGVDAWVSPTDLPRTLRAGYEPESARLPEELASRQPLAVGVVEEWEQLRVDSALHVTYWVTEWPRMQVHPWFLQPLLLAPGYRASFSLIAEPMSPARSLREIRRAKAEHAADAAQRTRIGQVEDESIRAEQADLARREAELVAGHGDFRFTGLITVSASSADELADACTQVERAASSAMLEVRRLFGQQGQAHAACALPLARGVL